MKPFAHANAQSVEDVVGVLSETCRPLAGGTDLLSLMKADLVAPERLVDLKSIDGLDAVRGADDGWHIGATARLSQVAIVSAGEPALTCLREAIVECSITATAPYGDDGGESCAATALLVLPQQGCAVLAQGRSSLLRRPG